MIYICCRCRTGIAVPEDFIGTLGECPDCRRTFRVAAGAGTKSIADDELDGRLTVRSGPQRVGEQLVLRGEAAIEIGKLAGKPIELAGNLVSRNHCKLIRTASGWRIEDQKSTNGLFVNGKQVAAADLKKGDVVRIGDYELEYTTNEPDAAALEEVQDIYEMAEEPTMVRIAPATLVESVAEALPGPGSIACPSCGKYLAANAKICVACGINVHTGRALILANDLDDEGAQERIMKIVRIASFIDPIGFWPVASEGYGRNKPYAVWAIAALTTLITGVVWISILSGPGGEDATKNLMLWSGGEPTAAEIVRAYSLADRKHPGAWKAMQQRIDKLERQMPTGQAIHAAYEELPPEERLFGQFHVYQLITNGLLHAGPAHLLGNLVFLLVFGSRVNALIGQWKTALLYPLLLIAASLAQLISVWGHGAQAALGASGAIMGLAGMYFVLFPVHRIFLIIWFRLTIWIFVPIWWTRVFYKMWALRGFWVVLFYISFDVLATVLGSRDHVAHWAHLGGFIAGMVVATALLLARQIDANRGDLFSVMLGRHAWALLGKPGERQQPMATAATVAA